MKRILILFVCPLLFIFSGACSDAIGIRAIQQWNDNLPKYTNKQIVDAIYKAEGGSDATYLYGIRSVPYDTPEEARRICFNTVRNNRVRYKEYGYKKFNTYLKFLADRYCPVNCDNDPRGLNKNWLKNVKYFLKKGE